MDCAKELNKVLVQVQALELVKERFNAGKPESKKMKIKTHYPKLLTASLTGKTADFIKAMDELIDPESLLYEVVGDQEAIDKGSVAFSKVESNDKFWQREFYQKFNKETVAKKEDIIMAYMRLNSLYQEAGLFDKKGNAEKAFELRMEAEKLMQDISSYATRTGQFIQGLSMLKRVYGGKKTDSIVKTINNNTYNSNRPKAKKAADKMIEDVKADRADAINTVLTEIINEPSDEIVNQEVKKKTKNGKPKTPAEILAKRLEAMFKTSDSKTQTEITRMINRLYQKASEAKQDTITQKPTQFQALAEIMLNRKDYNDLWNDAWEIASKNLDQNSEFAKYVVPFQDFASSEKFLQNVVRATLNVINDKKPLSQWAKEYFIDSESSVTSFVNALEQSLIKDNEGVVFTEEQMDYVKKYVLAKFEKEMNNKREQLQKKYNNALEKNGKLKPISKSSKQKLVEQLVDATFYDALNTVEVNKVWAHRFGVNPELSPEQIAKIRSKIIELTNEKDPEKLEIEVDKLIDDLTKGAPADLLTSFRVSIKAGMLASSRVWLNNVVGNYSVIPYYITMDAVKQGVFRSIKSVYKGVKLPRLYGDKIRLTFTEKDDIGRAVNQHANLEAIQYHLRQTEKFDIVSIGRANQVLFGSVMNADYAKWFDNAIRLPFRAMTSWKFIGDQTPFQFHYRYAFGNKLSALRYKESLSEEQKADMIQTARDYAIDIALTRTFRKMYKVAKIYNSAKSKNKVVQFIADISVPFINTGVAMSVEAYKFSPYALPEILVRTGVMIKNPTARTPENIDKVASLASQSLIGTTAMFSIGLLLGSLGMLDLDYPDNEKEREMWKAQGRQPYSIKAPWGSYTLDWINPLGTTMFYGAALGKALSDIEDDDTLDEVLKTAFDEGVLGSLNRFIDQSFVGQLRDDFGSGSIEEVGGNIGASFASQLIPAPMKIIANATDPYERITYIKGELGTTTWYKALGSVPVTRTGVLPIAYDVWGNKIKRAPSSNVLGRVGGAVLSLLPGRSGFEQTDALTDEVYKIYEESNNTGALPPVASSTITRTVNGVTQTVKLTLEDYSEYQRLLGESNREQAEKTIRRFNSTMSAEAKAKKLDSAYSKGKEKIRDQFFSEYGFD